MTGLHPQLVQDCFVLGRFPLCLLLLMNDATYPWFLLVPDREGVTELYQLDVPDQQQLLRESAALSRSLVNGFHPDKLNIAAIGNLVPQLHVHHVVRYRDDRAWPAPVWGRTAPRPYTNERLRDVIKRLKNVAPEGLVFEEGPGT